MADLSHVLSHALSVSLERIQSNQAAFNNKFPTYGSPDQLTYILNEHNDDWMAGFWPGLLWLAYVTTGDDSLRDDASSRLSSFEKRLEQRTNLTHDLGLIYTLSARAQWQLAADAVARQIALRAARELLARYRPEGQYIQAGGPSGSLPEGGRMIIDSMMSLPLLFWATAQTGDKHYYEAALYHAATAARHLVRSDGSTYQTFLFDQATGEPLKPQTYQGCADDSLWARGQAWAIYGFTLAAEWTGEERFALVAQQAAQRFMAELPPDGVPTWDLRLPADMPRVRDSSASAIAAGGMLRLARIMAAHGREWLIESAHRLMHNLVECCLEQDPHGQGLLRHGVYHMPEQRGVDVYLIFGDYFFLETLLAMEEKAPDFWGPSEGQE